MAMSGRPNIAEPEGEPLEGSEAYPGLAGLKSVGRLYCVPGRACG